MRKSVILLILVVQSICSLGQNKIIPASGHYGAFTLSISPDDRYIASGGLDKKLILADAQLATLKRTIQFPSSIYAICWNKNNQTVLTGNSDSILYKYDITTNKRESAFKMPAVPLYLSGNTQHDAFACALSNNQIIVADFNNGSVFFTIDAGKNVNGIQFSSNGMILFTSSAESGVQAFEMKSGKKVLSIPITNNKQATGFQLSANDERILIYISDGSTEVVETFTATKNGSLQAVGSTGLYYPYGYTYPSISADGKYLIERQADNTIKISSIAKNTSLFYNNTFTSEVIEAFVPSHKNDFFLLCDADGLIGIAYFSPESYINENPFIWKKIIYPGDRIFNTIFNDNENNIAFYGKGIYNFNLATGDLYRRDNDSLKVAQGEYFNRYVFIPEYKDRYYYTDILHHTAYEIINDKPEPIPYFAHNADTTTLGFINSKAEFIVYDIKKKKIINKQKIENPDEFILFNGTLNNCFITQQKTKLQLNDFSNGTKINIDLPKDMAILNIDTDKKMSTFYILETGGTMYQYNISKKQINKYNSGTEKIDLFDLADDGSIITLVKNSTIEIHSTEKNTIVHKLQTEHTSPLNISTNSKNDIISISYLDGITEIYNLENGKKCFNALMSLNDGMIVYTDDNYFMSTKEAARHLNLSDSELSLASFNMQYNRPDLVLKNSPRKNDKIIRAYETAYSIRKKKYVKESAQNPERIQLISGLTKLKTDQSTTRIYIKTKTETTKEFITWINDVPVQNRSKYDKTNDRYELELDLMSGTNHIKIAAIGKNGIQSNKEEISVMNTSSVLPDLYLLCIGTSEYKNTNYNLNYAAKDAMDLAELFGNKNKTSSNLPYNKVFIKTLTNKEVTKDAIFGTKEFLGKAKPNDMVIVFFAGHGVRDNEMKYYFGTHDCGL